MPNSNRIFLAHAREDKAQVQNLYRELQNHGFEPWLDEFDLVPGQIWKDEIPKAIANASIFLACISSRSSGKVGYVQNEFRRALVAFGERPPGSIYLIPVRLDDCDVPDLRDPDLGRKLTDIHWVDLFEENGFEKLSSAIGQTLDSNQPLASEVFSSERLSAATDKMQSKKRPSSSKIDQGQELDGSWSNKFSLNWRFILIAISIVLVSTLFIRFSPHGEAIKFASAAINTLGDLLENDDNDKQTGDRQPIREEFLSSYFNEGHAVTLPTESTDRNGLREFYNNQSLTLVASNDQFSRDLMKVFDEEGQLKLQVVIGRNPSWNMQSVFYSRYADMAIVPSDALASLKLQGFQSEEPNVSYITKLYDEEVHILARDDVYVLRDLVGQKVSIGSEESGTAMTGDLLFSTLEIAVDKVRISDLHAIEKLRTGEIAAAVLVGSKPIHFLAEIEEEANLHLIEIDMTEELNSIGYLSTSLTKNDYPELIDPGQPLQTVAVGAVIATYNWRADSNRYRSIGFFAEQLLAKLSSLQDGTGYHPKWKDVDPSVEVPNWQRFKPVEALVDR